MMKKRNQWKLIELGLALCIPLLLAACASRIPDDYPRITSNALEQYQETTAGRIFEEAAAEHPGMSGVTILRRGRNAFNLRVAMTELAERTLDLQYYIWDADSTGRILAERLVRAADRGVRVRLLVDDNSAIGRDAGIASLDAHPNIEIRLFNPFANRSGRLINFLADFDRVNHRMHNKIMVMDNAVVIVGGRNIGDHYFGVNTEANYRDLDIIAVGPVVREASTVFDHFWNGDWAVPIEMLVDRPYTETDLQATLAQLRETIARDNYPYPLDQDMAELRDQLTAEREKLIWAPATVVYDNPEVIGTGISGGVIDTAFYRKMANIGQEILIESAYFVPGKRGVAVAKDLHQRGVRVRILTNSLASNDVIAAHAGHAKYRRQLVGNGVELYELRPDIGVLKQSLISTESKAGLHTKAMVFDRESVFIGSFNLDPRSANINTEAGVYVESPEFAERVIDFLDEGVTPDNSYRVLLDKESDQLYWLTEIDGESVRYDKDPKSSFWQRFIARLISILPVESQL